MMPIGDVILVVAALPPQGMLEPDYEGLPSPQGRSIGPTVPDGRITR